MRHLTTPELCEALPGISYRQIDHACRLGLIPDNASGSGSRRSFDPGTVVRLRVAAAVREASSELFHDPLPWPTLCASVMDGPEPPIEGYALIHGRHVTYTTDEGLAAVLIDYSSAMLVVHYDVADTVQLVAA